MVFRIIVVTATFMFWCSVAPAQTTLNPDISAVGDFRIFGHNDNARAQQKEKFNFTDPQLELNISGYLNPYARADAVVAWHEGHNAEIEELYATILRGLPLNSNLHVGKYLLEFGRLNPVHPHAYSFIKRPLPHESFFGAEGLADMAVQVGFLLPTGDAYTEFMAGLLKGDILAGHEHEHHEEGADEHERNIGFFGRLTSSFAATESAELAVGASLANAEHDEQLRSWLIGGDIKYKHKPSRYTALQIEAELIMRISEQSENENSLKSFGSYGYIDYRFKQKYNIGGIFEWTRIKEAEHHEGEEEHEIHEHDVWRAGLFTGFAPIEETSLVRLVGHWTKPEGSVGFWEVVLQLVISLGPHKPHNF